MATPSSTQHKRSYIYIVFNNDSPKEAYLDEKRADDRAFELKQRAKKEEATQSGMRHSYWHTHSIPLMDGEEGTTL